MTAKWLQNPTGRNQIQNGWHHQMLKNRTRKDICPNEEPNGPRQASINVSRRGLGDSETAVS